MTIISIVASALAASTFAAAGGEQIYAPALPNFIVGYEASDPQRGGAAIREEVPKGETVEAWSRMVTTQRFGGLAQQISIYAFANGLARRMQASCPTATIVPPSTVILEGHVAARLEWSCPRLESTGKAETMLFIGFAVGRDVLIKQVAFRGPHGATDLDWGRSFLDRLRFCGGSAAIACPG